MDELDTDPTISQKEDEPLVMEKKSIQNYSGNSPDNSEDSFSRPRGKSITNPTYRKFKKIVEIVKMIILITLFLIFCLFFALSNDAPEEVTLAVTQAAPLSVIIPIHEQKAILHLDIKIPIQPQFNKMGIDISEDSFHNVTFSLEKYVDGNYEHFENKTMELEFGNHSLPVYENRLLFDYPEEKHDMRLVISTSSYAAIPLRLFMRHQSVLIRHEVAIAFVILVGVYSLIIFDVISRPLAGMFGSFIAISILSVLGQKPNIKTMASFVDWDALGLVFGMMIIFGIFKTSGVFEFCAVKSYKYTKGRVWPLTVILSVFCFLVSIILDNVTLMLLMTPVTVQLCEVIGISPIPLLITECLFGNIGGAGTPLGEEFVIVLQNPGIKSWDIKFAKSFLFLFPASVICTIICIIPIRIIYRDYFSLKGRLSPEKLKLKNTLQVWKHTYKNLKNEGVQPENVLRELKEKITKLRRKIRKMPDTESTVSIEKLEETYKIHNKDLFIRSSIVLIIVLVLFFLESFISDYIHVSLPWIAMMGATTLLLFSGIKNIEEVFEHSIEWPTMIFFVTLFILIECLQRLGLIKFIGDVVQDIVALAPKHYQLAMGITVILWVSAFISSFVDNIPYITAMIPVILQLAEPPLKLPIDALLYSLSFGVCLGGSGTIIGCSANVIVADLSKKKGFPISFWEFFKVSGIFTLVTIFIVHIYLLVLYVIFEIHY